MAWGGLLVLLLGLVATTVLVVALPGGGDREAGGLPVAATDPPPGDDVAGRTTAAQDDPRSVLRSWDRRRSRAWATADPAALADLYTPRSVAGARDLAMLERWRDRGLRVTGLDTQVLDLQALEREPRRLVLRVEDRVSSAVARGVGGAVLLPADDTQTRTVTLVRTDRVWRVAAVGDEQT